MIDLSFLTEEEQETILSVLKRDAELKKTEEQRVQNLQKRVGDRSQLRYLTGEWFYETKQIRHQDRIHGSDIIRASMKHTHKSLTILELSQILPERSSFVRSENKEVFVPPALCGLLQEPHAQLNSEGDHNLNDYQSLQDSAKPVLQSPTKRKNPFNSELTFNEEDDRFLDGAVNQGQTPNENVSEHYHLELLSPAVSSFVSAERESGKPVHTETGSEEDCHSQLEATDWSAGRSVCSVDATSDTKPSPNGSSKSSSLAFSPKLKQGLIRMFTREQDKTAQELQQKEELNISKQKEPSNTQHLSEMVADVPVDKPASVKQEPKLPEMVEVRTLQLTALQNTPFKETVTSVDANTQQEATKGRDNQISVRLSNLKTFWERENSGPKVIFTREGPRQDSVAKTGVEALHCPQTNSNKKNIDKNLSPQIEMTEEDATGWSQDKRLSPQTVCSVDLSRDDGTYRANPVFIYEETDDSVTGSLTESQVSEQEENVSSSVLPIVALNTPKLGQDIPVPLPRQSSSTHQEGRITEISEPEYFGEKEHTRPKKISEVKEASSSSVIFHKPVSSQSDLRTSVDNEEKSGIGAETFSYKTKSNVLKSLKVTEKGFVSHSPDRSQLRSTDSVADVQSPGHRYQVMVDTESQERPCSPSKFQTPRSKDEDETVRRSPSKTCHPKVLPRESSSAKGSRLEDSPLKTFSIDINPQTKATEEQQGKPTPVPRQRRSPSHAAKQTVSTDLSADITSPPLHQSSSNSSTSPHSRKASEKNLGTFTRLARSFIPQDHQHYLGPNEKTHIPHFHQDSDAVLRPKSADRELVRSDSPTEGSPHGISSWSVQIKDGNSSPDAAARAWSLSQPTSGSHSESTSPIVSALKRLSSRSMTSSRSLEKLTSETKERTQSNPREQMNLSVDDVSSLSPSDSSLSNPKTKTSVSVPVLQQDETDSDSTLDTNLGFKRKASSSMSNISVSSGMASLSSQVSGSLSSIYPSDFGDIEVQGSIQFAVNYIQNLGEFHIFVVLCRDLAVADTKKNCSDSYVKCYLLPDKTKLGKRKTTVKKKMLNPTFNEILRFKILMEVLKTQNLNVSIWHNNTFGRNSFLGEVDLDLSEWDFRNTQINEYALKARVSTQTSTLSASHLMNSRGQMRVALRFLPQTSHRKTESRMETGEVQIWVKDCKNLPSVRGVTIDPFVKCTVLPDTSRKSRQKTRVVKRTANPMFNHTMVYDGFRTEDLREACVELTVWDYDRLHNHYIGGLRLGLGTGKSYGVKVVWMDSTPDEANLWQRMLQSDGEWVEDELPLRKLVMAKITSK
ncbi:synaptotagmin-like protein 2 isoform X3 [Stegastes partitus]|uniref:Synaptotagmin-like protein 2 n=1 Tax=Stegastes partitus TaxID=144197 RepID=A0A9Y4N187_9TELE|nr:PREDICTED: synaptotagmin-like protein 2 isoform X3 [Stegastes partitus]